MGAVNQSSGLQNNLVLMMRVLVEQPELREREMMFGKKREQGIAVCETAELLETLLYLQ